LLAKLEFAANKSMKLQKLPMERLLAAIGHRDKAGRRAGRFLLRRWCDCAKNLPRDRGFPQRRKYRPTCL